MVQRVMSATSFREKIVKKYITKLNVKVLDIGCGPAEILSTLPNIQYYGFDINLFTLILLLVVRVQLSWMILL